MRYLLKFIRKKWEENPLDILLELAIVFLVYLFIVGLVVVGLASVVFNW